MRKNNNPTVHFAGEVNYEHEKPFFKRMHNHPDCIEIILLCEGKGNYNINGVDYFVKPPAIVVYNQGAWHEEQTIDDIRTVMKYVAFSNLQITGLPLNHLIKSTMSPVIPLNNFLIFKNLFEEIIYENSSKNIESQNITSNLVSILVSRVLRLIHEKKNNHKESNTYKIAKEIKHYIQENYHKNLTLDDLSQAFYLSPYYLSHLFKNITEISPIQYLINYRIEVAKHLLLTTSLPINTIAFKVGYQNSPHFYNTFKKITDYTPGQYRKFYNTTIFKK